MILDLGRKDYNETYRIQRRLVDLRVERTIDDTVVYVEHEPVFTIGRSGSRDNLLVHERVAGDSGVSIVDADRGGDITFHGHGQLTAYFIVDLNERSRDIHKHLRDIEEAAIDLLKTYNVSTRRIPAFSGVWAKEKKIASVGIAVRKWVTYHGISIYVSGDLSYFSMIHPCGIRGIEVTSLSEVLGKQVSLNDAKERFTSCVEGIFGIRNTEHRYESFSLLDKKKN
ncbi:MAG: lipoyl(octanoyl) transferase LipB [Candidatus Omnitrophota bacterium]